MLPVCSAAGRGARAPVPVLAECSEVNMCCALGRSKAQSQGNIGTQGVYLLLHSVSMGRKTEKEMDRFRLEPVSHFLISARD